MVPLWLSRISSRNGRSAVNTLGSRATGGAPPGAATTAVAAAAVLSVTEPMMTGIGGDLFALIWVAKEKKLVALNASGRAGAKMTREELLKRGRTRTIPRGVETITVPGALAGWQTLLTTYGTRTLAASLPPHSGQAQRKK